MNSEKFLEAQSIMNKISNLEKWLKDTKQESAKIGVCWPVYTQEMRSINSLSWQPESRISYITNELPKDLVDKVIQLVNEEIERLHKEFNEL